MVYSESENAKEIQDDISYYIKEILKCEKIKIYFKTRPDIEEDLQKRKYGLSGGIDRKIIIVNNLQNIIKDIDVVLGAQSTFLYDMVSLLKPVCIMETCSDYANRMVENGIANLIKKDNKICSSIKNIAHTTLDILEDRKVKLCGVNDISFDDILNEHLSDVV